MLAFIFFLLNVHAIALELPSNLAAEVGNRLSPKAFVNPSDITSSALNLPKALAKFCKRNPTGCLDRDLHQLFSKAFESAPHLPVEHALQHPSDRYFYQLMISNEAFMDPFLKLIRERFPDLLQGVLWYATDAKYGNSVLMKKIMEIPDLVDFKVSTVSERKANILRLTIPETHHLVGVGDLAILFAWDRIPKVSKESLESLFQLLHANQENYLPFNGEVTRYSDAERTFRATNALLSRTLTEMYTRKMYRQVYQFLSSPLMLDRIASSGPASNTIAKIFEETCTKRDPALIESFPTDAFNLIASHSKTGEALYKFVKSDPRLLEYYLGSSKMAISFPALIERASQKDAEDISLLTTILNVHNLVDWQSTERPREGYKIGFKSLIFKSDLSPDALQELVNFITQNVDSLVQSTDHEAVAEFTNYYIDQSRKLLGIRKSLKVQWALKRILLRFS